MAITHIAPMIEKRLKELNVKQESLFWWVVDEQDRWEKLPTRLVYDEKVADYESYWSRYSAFTVAELGEMLSTKENNNQIRTAFAINQWVCDYETYRTFGDTEADARASMLIYLLENNLITLPSKHIN